MKKHLILSAGTVALLSVTIPAYADDSPPNSEVLVLEPVTVTANKREQQQDKIDGSVSVRTAEDLKAAGVSNVADLEKVFPGLQIRSRGSSVYANVSVRGVTSPDFYNPAVQIYVDGVPQSSSHFTQSLMDVERVELLRGPQGTLYGSNAYGGVINIITRKPETLTGMAAVGVSTQGQTADTAVSTPIVPGKLYGDVAISSDWRQGTIDDTATGESNSDDRVNRSARARLRYAPQGGPFSLSLSGQKDVVHSNEEVVVANIYDRTSDSSLYGKPRIDKTVDTFAMNADYDLANGTLSSITSYQDVSLDRFAYGLHQPEDQNTLSQEIRYAFGEKGPLSGVAGGFFQYTDFDRHNDPYSVWYGASDNSVETRSLAMFGEATYKLTSQLDLTGGLRYSHENSKIDFHRGNSGLAGFTFQNEADFDDISPKMALGWQVAPDHRLYAQVSRGYKPGGFNHTVMSTDDAAAYDPETSTNWEVGWHGNMLDRRIQANVSAYLISATDKQIYVNVLGTSFQTLRNMGDSRSVGIEFDVTATPVDSIRLTFGGQAGRSTFVDSRDPNSGADYDGNRLPYAPDYTLNVAAQYLVPQTGLPGELSVRTAGRYFSRTYFDPANTLQQGGYPLFDMSVDLALDSGLFLSLFADNVADRVYRTYSFYGGATGTTPYSSLGDGRIVGLRGGMTF